LVGSGADNFELHVDNVYLVAISGGTIVYDIFFDITAKTSAVNGTYQVSLVTVLMNSSHSVVGGYTRNNIFITVTGGIGPLADFHASPISGTAPLTVQFTDQSTGDITSRSWDFGDGEMSTSINPSHTYQNTGTYTVSLTVTGPVGTDTETRSNYINVYSAQYVNVIFKVNAATVPDTIGPNSTIQIRGTIVTPAGRAVDDASADMLSPGVVLTWNGQSTLFLDHIQGDYWEGTFPFFAGSQVCYKFYHNASHDTVYSSADWEHRGWESDINPPEYVYGMDRGLDLSTFAGTDTILPLQFVNGQLATAEQYFRPYTETDSIDVWFRINIQTYENFNPETQIVGVRGGTNGMDIGDLSWDRTFYLTRESQHANGGSRDYNGEHFWSGRVRLPNDVDIGTTVEYKFVVMNQSDPSDAEPIKEEEIENRFFTITPAQSDTTLHWDIFTISTTEVEFNKNDIPINFALFQNYPNPFNPSTQIEYDVKEACKVNLVVYNLNGQVIKVLVNSYQQPGNYSINLNIQETPSGIYFYKIRIGDFQAVKKMVKIE